MDKLTPSVAFYRFYEAFESFHSMCTEGDQLQLIEECGSDDPEQIWYNSTFSETCGVLKIHQTNDITMVWNPGTKCWDDEGEV